MYTLHSCALQRPSVGKSNFDTSAYHILRIFSGYTTSSPKIDVLLIISPWRETQQSWHPLRPCTAALHPSIHPCGRHADLSLASECRGGPLRGNKLGQPEFGHCTSHHTRGLQKSAQERRQYLLPISFRRCPCTGPRACPTAAAGLPGVFNSSTQCPTKGPQRINTHIHWGTSAMTSGELFGAVCCTPLLFSPRACTPFAVPRKASPLACPSVSQSICALQLVPCLVL